jgi:hypothetical protein
MARAQPILGINPEDSVLANATLIVPVRIAELLSWERFVSDPARVAELHEMRIAAKRLRYTLELIAPLYDGTMDEPIDRVKKIQEHLGSIHDADVLVPELEAHLLETLKSRRKDAVVSSVEGGHFEAAAGLLTLCRRKRDERGERFDKFNALWQRLREEAFFERLRATVQRAAADELERLAEERMASSATVAPRRRKSQAPAGGE